MATVVKDFNSNQRKKKYDGKHYHIEFEFGFGDGGVWEAERWHNKM